MYIINKQKIERNDDLHLISAVFKSVEPRYINHFLIHIKDGHDHLYSSDKIDEILNAIR